MAAPCHFVLSACTLCSCFLLCCALSDMILNWECLFYVSFINKHQDKYFFLVNYSNKLKCNDKAMSSFITNVTLATCEKMADALLDTWVV